MNIQSNKESLNVSVIIPSLNPDEKLRQVVDGLVSHGFEDIIIVNDGSDDEHIEPFKILKGYSQCTILKHDVNMGKGRALKDAFTFVYRNRKDIAGVVTVDGDNQHGVKDIINCGKRMVEAKDKVILGVRDFSGDDVPFKSRFGNGMTSFVFKFACGLNISDTQTGLRAIPYKYLDGFSKIKGERFEYETNMLLELKSQSIPFEEVKIETIYINENETTHFHPIRDSFKIYRIIFAFIFSSLMASIIDIAMFTIILFIIGGRLEDYTKLLIATIGARIISSLFNFTMNRKAVFKSEASLKQSMIKYYILCVLQMMASYGLVFIVSRLLGIGDGLTSVAKAVIDTILFFVSFNIQRAWVFKKQF